MNILSRDARQQQRPTRETFGECTEPFMTDKRLMGCGNAPDPRRWRRARRRHSVLAGTVRGAGCARNHPRIAFPALQDPARDWGRVRRLDVLDWPIPVGQASSSGQARAGRPAGRRRLPRMGRGRALRWWCYAAARQRGASRPVLPTQPHSLFIPTIWRGPTAKADARTEQRRSTGVSGLPCRLPTSPRRTAAWRYAVRSRRLGSLRT